MIISTRSGDSNRHASFWSGCTSSNADGFWKSICFQVPALIQSGITLVISPLVSLMHNQVEALAAWRLRLPSTLQKVVQKILLRRQITNGQIKLIYLSPERLMSERMLNALTKHNVGLIAVDEAHCISQWGPNLDLSMKLGKPQTLFPRDTYCRPDCDSRFGDASRYHRKLLLEVLKLPCSASIGLIFA